MVYAVMKKFGILYILLTELEFLNIFKFNLTTSYRKIAETVFIFSQCYAKITSINQDKMVDDSFENKLI